MSRVFIVNLVYGQFESFKQSMDQYLSLGEPVENLYTVIHDYPLASQKDLFRKYLEEKNLKPAILDGCPVSFDIASQNFLDYIQRYEGAVDQDFIVFLSMNTFMLIPGSIKALFDVASNTDLVYCAHLNSSFGIPEIISNKKVLLYDSVPSGSFITMGVTIVQLRRLKTILPICPQDQKYGYLENKPVEVARSLGLKVAGLVDFMEDSCYLKQDVLLMAFKVMCYQKLYFNTFENFILEYNTPAIQELLRTNPHIKGSIINRFTDTIENRRIFSEMPGG